MRTIAYGQGPTITAICCLTERRVSAKRNIRQVDGILACEPRDLTREESRSIKLERSCTALECNILGAGAS